MVTRYLDLIPLEKVPEVLAASFALTPSTRRVPIPDATGLVTAAPIFARFSQPEVHLAAMDGIAVRAADTTGADEQHPVPLPRAIRVNTGNVLPEGYDAVIMIEDVWQAGDRYTIRKPVSPWQHVRPVGEDIGVTEMVLPSRHRIRPHEIGALAAFGIREVEVLTVQAGIVPTGSELVPFGQDPGPGQVVESNSLLAAAYLEALGARCTRYPRVPDDPPLIREALDRAVRENDLAIVSAGSSAGTRDYTATIIEDAGEVIFHGVAMKPGKPVILGRVQGKPVIGLPGYPLSALTVLREIVAPLLGLWGLPLPEEDTLQARVTRSIPSEPGVTEFILAAVARVGERWVAEPLSRGAGVQMAAVRANACFRIDPAAEGVEAGSPVTARLMVPRAESERALLLTGSHDPALDHLADLVRPGVDLHAASSGSLAGLLALSRGECHAAPTHLLGPDGSYNTWYLERYLPGTAVDLVCVAGREQGVVSRDGLTLDDLPSHRFVNRQKGSGTRMLLDYLLAERGISPASLRGYDREMTTHLAVALAVKSGEADCGICVYSAAKALGLAFVPVGQERYELAIRREQMTDPRIQALVTALGSPAFRDRLTAMGGYDTTLTGVQRGQP
ncbi:MAG: molybdopterin biosynthesis protein [Methanomicrobiales archaeon]|nr:molybdopterin biosynthesis protein [Methanomicrobiales archaeon]